MIKIPYQALSLWEALCLLRHHKEGGYFDADERAIILFEEDDSLLHA